MRCRCSTELFETCAKEDDQIGVVHEGDVVIFLGEAGVFKRPEWSDEQGLGLLFVLTPSGVGWVAAFDVNAQIDLDEHERNVQ